ncbi:hypothetical protein BHM03_00055979 [Ensete ventricosum]|nr:hypothetical protein BHM03_00055979 [Ensete ventricosum]
MPALPRNGGGKGGRALIDSPRNFHDRTPSVPPCSPKRKLGKWENRGWFYQLSVLPRRGVLNGDYHNGKPPANRVNDEVAPGTSPLVQVLGKRGGRGGGGEGERGWRKEKGEAVRMCFFLGLLPPAVAAAAAAAAATAAAAVTALPGAAYHLLGERSVFATYGLEKVAKGLALTIGYCKGGRGVKELSHFAFPVWVCCKQRITIPLPLPLSLVH